nr:hypothetical protein [Tanacetum cinerariifolium]
MSFDPAFDAIFQSRVRYCLVLTVSGRAASDAGPPRSCVTGSFPFSAVFRTADVGWLGAVCSGLLMGSDAVCYTKPLYSLKGWNDHFFWIDAFACPALFMWHTCKILLRDVIPKSSEFSSEHYATLVVYPAPFHKYPEPFLCLVGMSQINFLSFIRIVDPTKVRIGERQRDENEPKLLETTVVRVVPLLPVAPDRSSGELEASVEKLFGEGWSGEQVEQGDSAGGGHGVSIDVVVETSVEDVALAQLKRQKKRKTKVADAGEPSHPAKKLRDDYGAPGGPTVGGKSQSSIQRLLAGAMQNVEVNGGAMPTFLFVSSSISTTPEREGEYHTELLAEVNLYTIGAPQSHPIPGGFSDLSGSDFLGGGIRTVIEPDSNLQKVYVPQWNVTNGFSLDDGGVCREMVDEFSPPKFFASVCGMDHD